MLKEVINSNPGWNVTQIILSYFGLPEYMKYLEFEYINQDRITIIHSIHRNARTGRIILGEQLFWGKIFDGRILEGEKVELVDFNLSEWFPRKPGLYWTYQGRLAREKAKKYIISEENGLTVFNVHGKTLMSELGGIGTVKFKKNRELNLLTASSRGEVHSGIPILVTNEVWKKIYKELNSKQFLKASMKGRLVPCPSLFNSYFLRSPNIPKVAVLINNIHSISIEESEMPIIVSPWTIFERKEDTNGLPYGFTYATCDLGNEELDDSINWMKNYINDNSGELIVTDFDEENNQMNAMFTLSDDTSNPAFTKKLFSYLQKVQEKYK